MPSLGELKIVIGADTRPFDDALLTLSDRLAVEIATTPARRAAAYARLYQRQLNGAGEAFAEVRCARWRFDPRRLGDRWHERSCRTWARRFGAAKVDGER